MSLFLKQYVIKQKFYCVRFLINMNELVSKARNL